MQDVDRIKQDVGSMADDVGENLTRAVNELAKEVRRMTGHSQRRIPAGLIAIIALGLIALAAAILGGMKAVEQQSTEVDTEPYA
jgi:hypothetical protein